MFLEFFKKLKKHTHSHKPHHRVRSLAHWFVTKGHKLYRK